MLSTYQALAVALVALLPGASYTFAVERSLGSYGVKFSDRLVRFLAASAIFHALASGPEYLLYRHFFATDVLTHGHAKWWAIEIVAIVYVFLPIGIGSWLAHLRQPKKGHQSGDDTLGTKVARWALGEGLEPRAWDWMWKRNLTAILRIKLKSGVWVAGLWGDWESEQVAKRRSYAAGYPEEGDMYLSVGFKIDPATGELVRNSTGTPEPVDGERGLLVRWAEVEYLEFQEF